jgi:hypothetical protein
MPRKRRKRRGRPATGQDPIVTVRLPAKLLQDIDAWAVVYRDPYEGMDRSTAIRCLILLGLQGVHFRVIDPKDKITFEGETLPLLKFFRRAKVGRWLRHGTPKAAKQKPPAVYRSRRPAQLTKAEVNAAVNRAIARSKDRHS